MSEAKQRCTMREFRQWAIYETIEPFGDFWQIQHGAVLCAAALNFGKKRGGRTFKPSDFLPKRANRRLTRSELMILHNAAKGAK